MSRHVLIALREAFNGWAYWTHYEKKMNMSIQDSDGGTCASSEDMTQDEFDEMNQATRLPLPTPGVDKKLDSGVDEDLTSCSESPTSSSMSLSPNAKQAEVFTKAQGIEEQGFDLSKVRVVLVEFPLDPRLRDRLQQ